MAGIGGNLPLAASEYSVDDKVDHPTESHGRRSDDSEARDEGPKYAGAVSSFICTNKTATHDADSNPRKR